MHLLESEDVERTSNLGKPDWEPQRNDPNNFHATSVHSPIPPNEELVNLKLFLRIFKKIKQTGIESLWVGDIVCSGKDRGWCQRKPGLCPKSNRRMIHYRVRLEPTCVATYANDAGVTRVMPWIRAFPERVAFASFSTELGDVKICLNVSTLSEPLSRVEENEERKLQIQGVYFAIVLSTCLQGRRHCFHKGGVASGHQQRRCHHYVDPI